jgi:hypothetical protein
MPRFAVEFHLLVNQGVHAERYNLAQQPRAIAANRIVIAAREQEGNRSLPLALVDGAIDSRGWYPTRERPARMAHQE